MQPAIRILRRAIRTTGFDVVRVTAGRGVRLSVGEGAAAAGEVPGSTRDCFPGDPSYEHCRPWPIPKDLHARTEPWARVLVELYQRPASWPACVSPECGMFIHALVRNIRPRVVVETGTCHGASTLWIAGALDLSPPLDGEAAVHTFDNFALPPDPATAKMPLFARREELVRERFEKSGLGRMIRVHKGDSATEVARARRDLDGAGGVQLAFIDGDHTVEGVRRDFEAVEPSLNIGGYILLHDVFPEICTYKGPRWLADNVNQVASGRYQVCDVYTSPLNYGVTVLRRLR